MKTPVKIYKERVKSGEIKPDIVQERAVLELQRLYDDLIKVKDAPKLNFLQRMAGFKQPQLPVGIYMYGGVGVGKSMLMDLFYDCLPNDISKRRVHFHEFMIDVHDYINTRCDSDGINIAIDQALPLLAQDIAVKYKILCFDEFHVVDIVDAMILGRLFTILFDLGLVVVATSNWAPDDLYKDGLQRERFLPFIDLLKSKVKIIYLDSNCDYRTQNIKIDGTYFTPLGEKTSNKLNEVFYKLTNGSIPHKEVLHVKGRDIEVEQVANGVARFNFSQLCERPHGAEDYLEIARKYHTVFIEDVPKLGYDRRNEAKRLMNLIDALYEARVRVIISAEVGVDKLYRTGDHVFEFERTVSRLKEMQSDAYP